MTSTVDVLTNRYNNGRTGFNLGERKLNTANVNVGQFGLLFSRPVSGQIYAQPLVVSRLPLPGGRRPVVYVATTNNNVYCFDAEDPAVSNSYWQVNLGVPVPNSDYGIDYHDFKQNIGIVSTPAIDLRRRAMWVTAKTREPRGDGVHYVYRLHALDLVDGSEKFGGPVVIADSLKDAFVSGPTFPGTGDKPASGVPAGMVALSAYSHLNRPGLLLWRGVLYLAFGSHGDRPPYHGWVLAFKARTLRLLAVYCNTPNSGEGGIWQSGNGLAADEKGFVYAVAGNGASYVIPSAANPDFGCNVVKLRLRRKQLDVVQWFAPFDAQSLNAVTADQDLCSGPLLLSGTKLVMGSGKDGKFYVLNRDKMGKFLANSNNSQIHQCFPAANWHIHGTPACWDRPRDKLVYVWSEADALKAYKFHSGKFDTIPASVSTISMPDDGCHMPGGMLTGSAHGSHKGSGILWATHPVCGDANANTVDGMIRAFDAADVAHELWNSESAADHSDRLGKLAKFNPPAVANGHVYVGTFSDKLQVYGLLKGGRPRQRSRLGWEQCDIGSFVFGWSAISCGKFTVSGGGSDIWDINDGFHFVFRPFSGDGQIIAQVSSIVAQSPWAKSGVMFRDLLDPGSRNVMMALTTGNGAAFQWRPNAGGLTQRAPGPNVAAPYWVKLTRLTDTFSGYVSPDGINWLLVGSQNVAMNPNLSVGLAVSGHLIDAGRVDDFTCQHNDTIFLNVETS